MTYVHHSWFTTVALTQSWQADFLCLSSIQTQKGGTPSQQMWCIAASDQVFQFKCPHDASLIRVNCGSCKQSKLTMFNANYFLTIPQQNIQSNNTYKLLTEDVAGDFELDPNPVSLVCKK